MFDVLKQKVNAKLIFQFMKNVKKPEYFKILNCKKNIDLSKDEVKIDFDDSSINEYKVYDCDTKYIDRNQTNSISIYYNQTNYFQCGDGKHSVEIIFSDFLNKSIKSEDCCIEYEGIKYFPKEDFGLLTRKRINFLNVDMNKFKFPKTLNDKEINLNTIDNKNFLVSISIIDKPKIIAIYLNNPFIENKLKNTESELIEILNSSLDKIRKIVYVNKNEDYDEYMMRYKDDKMNIYIEEIRKSHKIEKRICEYFSVPRKELNQEQIKIYDKYSDFMAYFPDIPKDSRKNNNINGLRYYQQYYYTATSLNNLNESIPKNISQSDKVKLKYSACRCLRTLLENGKGESLEKLFEFRDFTKEKTIYYEANSYNKKFIGFLNEKSEIFLFFLQINSGSGINLITKEFMSRISMLNEQNIKDNLLSTIPKYGIKFSCDSKFNACTFNEVKITCINEQNALGASLEDYNLTIKKDPLYNKRYLLANLMQHEDFGHINFSINFYAFYDEYIRRTSDIHSSENLSPFKYYMINSKGEKIQEIVKEEKIINLKRVKETNEFTKKKETDDEKEQEDKEEDKINENTKANEEKNKEKESNTINEKKEKSEAKIKRKSKSKQNEEIVIKGESGIALSFFLTRGKYQLMKLLRQTGIEFKELFEKPELQAAEDLTEFINKLSKIYQNNNILFEYAEDADIEYKTRFQNTSNSNPIPYGIPTLEKFN